MSQLNSSKFCHKICHIFGERVVRECKNYISLYSFQPVVANVYKRVFDFCERSVPIERLWVLYGFCRDKAQDICSQKCRNRVVEDCKDYVDKKLLDNDMASLKSYDSNKEASETTYFSVVVRRKVIDFCKSSQHNPKTVDKFDFNRIVDEITSIEQRVITDDLIEEVVAIVERLRDEKILSRDERMVLKMMLENYTYSEIAIPLDIETKEVYRIKDRAIEKIRRAWRGDKEYE